MLNMKALRRIKPLGCVDDYIAGHGENGRLNKSTLEIGQEYRKAVYDFLLDNGAATIGTISVMLNINVKALCSVIQKMRRAGIVKTGDKTKADSKKLAFTYLISGDLQC